MSKKKTTEEFKKEVYDLVGDEYSVDGDYVNSKTPIWMIHKACGNRYQVRPKDFLEGSRCPSCFGNHKKTTEEFKAEVFGLVGNEYSVDGDYVNNSTPIWMTHKACGNRYQVRPADFLKGSRCPSCFGNHKKTTEEFKQEVFNLEGDEYSVLGEYVDRQTPVLMRHNTCGHEWPVRPCNFKNGTRCPKCAGNIKRTTEEFKQEVFNLEGNEYSVDGDYVNNSTPIWMTHKACGNRYQVRPADFLKGSRCPSCFGNHKKTTEEFKAEVFGLVGNEYSVDGDYVNSKTPIWMIHKACGNRYQVRPKDFLEGSRCPSCFGNHKKTTEEFKAEVFGLVGNEYSVDGDYVNNSTPIWMTHKACGNRYQVRPADFLKGSRCPSCFGNHKKTTEEFKQEVFNLEGDEYSVLGEYVDRRTPVLMRHNTCGHEWPVRPCNFKNGTRCPKCAGNIKRTTEEFKQEVFNLEGDEYSVEGDYVNSSTPIWMIHNACRTRYQVRPADFLNGVRCPSCFGSHKKTTEEFKQEVFNLEGDEYSVDGDYVNNSTPIWMTHNACRTRYQVIPNNFLRGARCPICSARDSAGQRTVRSILDQKLDEFGLDYIEDTSFKNIFKKCKPESIAQLYDWCGLPKEKYEEFMDELRKSYRLYGGQRVSRNRLDNMRPDFTIYRTSDNTIYAMVEVDGQQHFSFVYYFYKTVNNFLNRCDSDVLKTKFLEFLEIPLLRIRYDQIDRTEEMIDDLLENPENYVERHNTFLTEEEYWEGLKAQKKEILAQEPAIV